MLTTIKTFASSVAAVTVLSLSSVAMSAEKDIVDTAVEAGSFKTLTTAVGEAGLVEALKGKGPVTVFAPTDEAFEKLPEGTVAELLKPENKEKLTAILTYHVVEGKVTADKVTSLKEAETLSGKTVDIAVKDGKVMINNATVVKADIMCTNGVIHVIDTVLLPKEDAKTSQASHDSETSYTSMKAETTSSCPASK